jgi:hypothetical protein
MIKKWPPSLDTVSGSCHTSYINKERFSMDIPSGTYLYFHEFAQAWASDDGSYGGEGILLYNPEDLTDKQRALVSDMYDYTRVEYIMACIDEDEELIASLEADYV